MFLITSAYLLFPFVWIMADNLEWYVLCGGYYTHGLVKRKGSKTTLSHFVPTWRRCILTIWSFSSIWFQGEVRKIIDHRLWWQHEQGDKYRLKAYFQLVTKNNIKKLSHIRIHNWRIQLESWMVWDDVSHVSYELLTTWAIVEIQIIPWIKNTWEYLETITTHKMLFPQRQPNGNNGDDDDNIENEDRCRVHF